MTTASKDHQALAASIAAEVKDYRADEGIEITPAHVLAWSDQFDDFDRLAILQETEAIMRRRYMSRADATRWLGGIFDQIATKSGASSTEQWLRETAFLDLQENGKSQKAMLALLDEVLQQRYGLRVADCGQASPRRYVYLDDLLCTGNTTYLDLTGWYDEQDDTGARRIDRLDPSIELIVMFVFAHMHNWHKLGARLRYWDRRAAKLSMWYGIGVQNDPGNNDAALDFAFPRATGHSSEVERYVEALGVAPISVFRRDCLPKKESLFTSPDGRDRFEGAILAKGLAMINRPGNRKPNIRPLGYTLPSHKTLGFGALAFTWRNVPNNSPLVFWYDSPIFTPLFPKRPYFGF